MARRLGVIGRRQNGWAAPCASAPAIAAVLVLAAIFLSGCSTPWSVRSVVHRPRAKEQATAPETAIQPEHASAKPDLRSAAPRPASRIHEWAPRSRSGRAALRGRRYADAERELTAALELTAGLRPDDLRTRASVGDLVRLAAQLRKLDRKADAARVMARVVEHLRAIGVDRGGIAAYESLFLAFTRPPSAIAIQRRRVTAGAHHRAPAVRTFDGLIAETARSFDVDPALVKAVVAAESNFDARAVSRVGAQGLMQLMPETSRKMGVTAPFEPSENLRGGVRYLSQLITRYGDLRRALAAYNAGPTAVDQYRGIPPYPETRAYVTRVLGYYRGYRNHFGN